MFLYVLLFESVINDKLIEDDYEKKENLVVLKSKFKHIEIKKPGFFKRFLNFFIGMFDKSARIYTFDDLIDSVMKVDVEKVLTVKQIHEILKRFSESVNELVKESVVLWYI